MAKKISEGGKMKLPLSDAAKSKAIKRTNQGFGGQTKNMGKGK